MVDPSNISANDSFYSIIAAIVGSLVSGIVLLLIHHSKVNQEIEKHRKIDNFEKKQNAYRKILELLSKMADHSFFLGKPVNWKIIRHAYDEIMLVGSKEVVEKTNELMASIGEDGSPKIQIQTKNLWNAIRKDLYGEELPVEQMHVISPSEETVSALSLYDKYANELKILDINTLEKARLMDVDKIHDITQIDKKELNIIRKMAENELTYEDEFQEFMDKK